ncbi:MAG: ABC transporter ATP-binding protein [Bacteroidota bacterium]
MPGIRIEHLEKRFGHTTAVHDLSLGIAEGEFVSFLGPSGCGKTTVLRSIAGLEMPDIGRIFLGERLVFSSAQGFFLPPGRRGIGMVFQNYALWPHLTVAANVAFGLAVAGVKRDARRERVKAALRLLGIEDLIDRYPSELSGGQQQRVALARAIVTEPPILLLDEPLSNLDAKLRLQMRTELQRLHHQLGCTIIYVTHDQTEAMTLSNRVVLMRGGMLQQVETPRTIYHHPANVWVADFIGNPSANILDGTVAPSGHKITLHCGLELRLSRYRLEPNQRVKIGMRPEDIQIGAIPGRLSFSGFVHSVQPAGNETIVQARLGSDIITMRIVGELDWALEREVSLCLDERKLLVFDAVSGDLISESRECSAIGLVPDGDDVRA